MEVAQTSTVGSFVANDYRAAAVFQKYGIDFCCKGDRTIKDVCEKKNIPLDQLLTELVDIHKIYDSPVSDFQSWPLDQLADHIERNHHRYLEQTTPALKQFFEKLCRVHGPQHPELFEINKEFNASTDELALHMLKEEMVLFPYIRTMLTAGYDPEKSEQSRFGTVQNPIRMMMHEHDVEGDRFRKISELSNNYTPPADACNTYRVAYALLKEFEDDLHFHIHLENNILFPKAIVMEKTLERLENHRA